jgi:hypothetical protein
MKKKIIIVIAAGFVIRLFCFHYTYIINPDGALYIHQARVFYFGLNDSLTSCGLNFLSNYPIIVAGAYAIVGDWVIAAKVVSLILGTLTLIPLYFLLKEFFDERISILTTLVFAFMPVLVDRSVDVVRAPVFWFFSVLGLYSFVRLFNSKNYAYPFLSSLCFLFAAWARIEAVLFIIVSCLYIVIAVKEKRVERFLLFVAPFAVLAILIVSKLTFNLSHSNPLRHQYMISYALAFTTIYEKLRLSLGDLANMPQWDILSRFLLRARHLIWWIALGTLLTSLIKAFFYPFFIVFLMGFKGIWKKIKEDDRILYLSIFCFSAFLFLCIVVMILWEMPTRYTGLLVFPSAVFIGFGLEKVMLFLRSKFNLKESIAFLIVCMLVLVFSLPKNLKPREKDKVVFKEIGQLVAEREGNDKEILVVTSQQSIRWISFYSNLDHKGAPCPEKNYDLNNILGQNYEEFVENLRERKIQYFLWEEKHWPGQSADYLRIGNSADFIRVGNWSHPDTGKLILFKVI